jgi:riboflavin synthase
VTRIGVVDTTFARWDMGAAALDELARLKRPGETFETARAVVPGIKDLPVAALRLLREGCDLVIACGMVGGAAIDKTCATVADQGIQQAQLMAGKPILGVFVYSEEAEDEAGLVRLMEARTRGHALNAYLMLLHPEEMAGRAGTGRRQGAADEGPIRVRG